MILSFKFFCICYLFVFVLGDSSSLSSSSTSTTTTKVSTTLVWVTGTDSAGHTRTTQSAYTQTFSDFYGLLASPSIGSIGIGSLSGSVGEIRTYSTYEVTHSNGATLLESPLNYQTWTFAKVGIIIVAFLGVLLM